MPKLEYSPAALEKLGAIYRYIAYELYNPNGAVNTVSSIREIIETLKHAPELGPPLTSRSPDVPENLKDMRVLLCGNYLAFYRYDGKTVKINRIYHTAQDYISHILKTQ